MSFKFSSIAHVAASVFHDVKVGVHDAVLYLSAHQSDLKVDAQFVASAASLISPQAGLIASGVERAGELLLGKAFETLSNADASLAANGTNLVLDAATVSDLKDLFSAVHAVKPLPTAATAAALAAGSPTVAK